MNSHVNFNDKITSDLALQALCNNQYSQDTLILSGLANRLDEIEAEIAASVVLKRL